MGLRLERGGLPFRRLRGAAGLSSWLCSSSCVRALWPFSPPVARRLFSLWWWVLWRTFHWRSFQWAFRQWSYP
ncbi:uncharacterized protein BKA78DRAFT_325949 [Phyllosticta capitalensis]|uniref:uncharacterized protein n=1 Tax=Phyllosticta capitalensis TaxID=121624 RepID=UPI003130C77D